MNVNSQLERSCINRITDEYAEGRRLATREAIMKLEALLAEKPNELSGAITMMADPNVLETFLGKYKTEIPPEEQAKIMHTIGEIRAIRQKVLERITKYPSRQCPHSFTVS